MIDFRYSRIVLLALLFSTSVFSQGEFLKKGTSGLSATSGYHYGEDYYDFNGKLGYSVKGVFDFGIGIAKEVNRQKVLDDDLNTLSLNPYIALNQHSKLAILSMNFSYRHDFISSDAFDILDIQARGDYYSAGSSIRLRIGESQSFFIQPSISADYVAGRAKAFNDAPVNAQPNVESIFSLSRSSIKNDSIYQEIPAGQTRSDFTQELILNFGVDFCFKASDRLILYLTPNFLWKKDDTRIGINAGIVLPTPGMPKAKAYKNEQIIPAMPRQKVIYIDIKNAMEKHFLIHMTNETPMKVGDSFYIVRADNQGSSNWMKIGLASVVKIQDNKVVLESDLYNENDRVTTRDKILFRY